MKKFVYSLVLLLGGGASLFGAIDGTVVNRTSGKPAAGVSITLLKPGTQGMQTLGATASDAAGHFVFEKDQPGGGPQLLQANYKGVTYNKLLTPNVSTLNIQLDIFESTKSPGVAKVAQAMLLLEPSATRVSVDQTVVIQNDSNTTYNNDELGGLRFYLPPSANGQVRVSAQGPQGMPLPREAEKTDEADIFQVNFPIKPGETQIQVTYLLPVGSPMTYRGRVVNIKGMQSGPLRLVVPPGVLLSGKDIEKVGAEPKTQATIYTVTAAADFSVDVAGNGSLSGNRDTTAGEDGESPAPVEARPQIYAHLGWLLTLGFAILALGFIAVYRSSPVRSPFGK